MKLISTSTLLITASLLCCQTGFAQTNGGTKTGPRGGTATGTTTRKGNTITGSGSATSAGGKNVRGAGTVTYRPGKASASGSVTGPKGNTSTASGTVTNSNGTVNGSGAATGPRGKTVSGNGTASNGSATITGASGKTKTFNGAKRAATKSVLCRRSGNARSDDVQTMHMRRHRCLFHGSSLPPHSLRLQVSIVEQ